jgi:O-antigen ligase
MTLWSTQLKRAKQFIVEGLLLFSPLAIYMIFSSSSAETQGSTDARAMLAGIAIELFRESPIIGVGAGTFVNHVAGTWAFIYEYGSPLDSHGYLQKLAAETGLLGLLAFTAVIITIGWYLWSTWKELKQGSDVDRTIFAYLCSGVIGAFIYQIFNTTYWTPKLWLPVGIALAASRMLVIRRREQDPSFLITKQSS